MAVVPVEAGRRTRGRLAAAAAAALVLGWLAFRIWSGSAPSAARYDWDFGVLWKYRTLLVAGLAYTLLFTVACVSLGLLVGLLVGLGRLSTNPFLTAPLRAYVEVFRCTPVLVQLVWFYYALRVKDVIRNYWSHTVRRGRLMMRSRGRDRNASLFNWLDSGKS